MDTYVITLSKKFPVWHPRHGELTDFEHKFLAAVTEQNEHWLKLHTIRDNYELWSKRFKKIDAGEACLSIRQWTNRPFYSKQKEIARLTKEDGIGLQKLEFKMGKGIFFPKIEYLQAVVRNTVVADNILSVNDGLSYDDWSAWFKDYDLSKPLAIIHFTKFRY